MLAKYPNINQIPFNSEPTVSDGPFRFAEWVAQRSHRRSSRNDNFFMGKPGLNRIEIKVIPDENTSVELAAHARASTGCSRPRSTVSASARTFRDIKIVWMRVNGYYDIQINTARPLLNDPRVRHAIAYAIDKQELGERH